MFWSKANKEICACVDSQWFSVIPFPIRMHQKFQTVVVLRFLGFISDASGSFSLNAGLNIISVQVTLNFESFLCAKYPQT